jgi:hypothetical protein
VKTPLLKRTILKILEDAGNLFARVKEKRTAQKRRAAKRRAARARDLARWRAATNCWPSAEDLIYLDEAGEDGGVMRNGEADPATEKPDQPCEPKAEGESRRPG